VWITVSSPETCATVAEKGYVIATLNIGFQNWR
jgi:hypothetical protein